MPKRISGLPTERKEGRKKSNKIDTDKEKRRRELYTYIYNYVVLCTVCV